MMIKTFRKGQIMTEEKKDMQLYKKIAPIIV